MAKKAEKSTTSRKRKSKSRSSSAKSETKKQTKSRRTSTSKKSQTTTSSPRTRRAAETTAEPDGLVERIRYTLQDPAAFKRFQDSLPSWTDEFGAFALIVIGMLTFSALLNPAGDLAGPFADALRTAFGSGAYLIALMVMGLGAILLLPKAGLNVKFGWTRILSLEVAFMALQGLFHLLAFDSEPRALAREGGGGGYVGWAISSVTSEFLGEWPTIFLLGVITVMALGIAIGITRRDVRTVILFLSDQLNTFASRLRPDPSTADDLAVSRTAPAQDERPVAPNLPVQRAEKAAPPPVQQQAQPTPPPSVAAVQQAAPPTAPTNINTAPPRPSTSAGRRAPQTPPEPRSQGGGRRTAPPPAPASNGNVRRTAPEIIPPVDNTPETRVPVEEKMPETAPVDAQAAETDTPASVTETASENGATADNEAKQAASPENVTEAPRDESQNSEVASEKTVEDTADNDNHTDNEDASDTDEQPSSADETPKESEQEPAQINERPPIPININGRTIEAQMPDPRYPKVLPPEEGDEDGIEYTLIVINGEEVRVPITDGPVKRRKYKTVSRTRKVNGRRQFTVRGFKDKVKIGRRKKVLPDLELLEYSELKLPSNEEVNQKAHLIEDTMLEFDIDADVIDVRVGPTITQYAVTPIKEVEDEDGEKIIIRTRVNKIAALANDLALALSTKTLRIEAPVPGHAYVGIEVPNAEPSTVSLRAMLEAEQYYDERKKPLAVPLGRDVSGSPVVVDLALMPHLLVAGTTGSGKSIGLRSMITSLIMSNSPDTLRMIILDPKIVEFTQFNGLPHLIGPVETDPERIIGVLRWATREMDRRYKLLEMEKARNIEAYNAILGRRRKDEHMPYIVIVVDEIGDLMMIRPDETEKTLTRLAQKARAAGMHMVLATQRPSVDVITGLIKANFPARISYAVASGVDSRVILDYTGAESLVGRGDMLFLGPDAAGPKRIQGCYVSDTEIDGVVDYWEKWFQEQIEAEKVEEPGIPPWEQAMTRLESLSDVDPILEEALSLVVMEGKASASLIQRRLGIGYPRAARLIDSLHELSIVGRPKGGGKTREVLVKSVEEARRMVQNNRRKQRY